MKVSSLHRKRQMSMIKKLRADKSDAALIMRTEISLKAAKVQQNFLSTREQFAVRAAKALAALPHDQPSVALGQT